jgi:hypothetical protein
MFNIHIRVHALHRRPLSVQAQYSNLCPTNSSSRCHDALKILERSYTWPPPSYTPPMNTYKKPCRIVVLIHCYLVANKGFLYLFIVTTQQDAFTHNKNTPQVQVILCPTVSRLVYLGVGPMTRLLLLSEICGLHVEGRPPWREDGSVIYSYNLLSHLRLPQPGRPGPRIYIPQEQGGPVIPPGTGFPSFL